MRVSSALLVAVLALRPSCAVAADPVPRSGHFDAMTLVVDGSTVAGVFVDSRGLPGPDGAPPFSCVFLLRGALAGARSDVETWTPGQGPRIRGTLAFTPEGATLTLREDHGGCPMTTGSMVGHPYALARTPEVAEGWRGVGLVTAKRVDLRPEPGPTPKRAPHLVAYDPVVVLGRRGAWVRVRYDSGRAPVLGWVRAADLATVEP